MFGYLPIASVGLVLLWLTRKLLSLRANTAIAAATGLPYATARKANILYSFASLLKISSPKRYRRLFLDSNSRSRPRHPQEVTLFPRLAMGNVCNYFLDLWHDS